MHGEDPDIMWLRQQVDQIFDGDPPTRAGDHVGIVVALATSLAFLSLLIGLTITAPL